MRRSLVVIILTACLLLGNSRITGQADESREVDLLLVLALDVSESLTAKRWEIQKNGYAAAFMDQEVLSIIQSGQVGAIGVTVMQWSSANEQIQTVDWSVIEDKASAEAFAATLKQLPRIFNGYTNIGSALMYCQKLIDQSPLIAPRHVCDISGDGQHRESDWPTDMPGTPLEQARDHLVRNGTTINGLPIIGNEFEIDKYYQQQVIGGEGAFSITIQNPDDIETVIEAIKKKLFKEIVVG